MAITIQERRKQFALTSAAGLAMAALMAVLVNLLGNWVFLRLDLTGNRAYSLSPSSRKLVRDLSDPVIVRAYFTPDLPAPYNAYERYVRDLLAEYRAASHGKVRFEFALPNPPADFEKKASEARLLPLQFEEMGSDQLQIRRGYMGLVLFHRDKSETLPVVKDVQQLEYDITSRIAKMAVRNKKTIALASGHREISWETGRTKLAQDVADLYDLKPVPLPPGTTTPLEADALLVAGPQQKMDDKSFWVIDQAIMHGIPTAFLVDIKDLRVDQFMVTPNDSGLGGLLQHYGIALGNRLVYDAQCETIGLTQNLGGFAFNTSMRYPYIPLIDRIVTIHPIARGLDTVALPFTTTVEAVQPLPAGVHFTSLFFTSPKSWLAPDRPYASVSPTAIPMPGRDDPHGPYSVGGVLEGMFTSYFEGKPIPLAGQTLVGTSPKTQIFVLGTARVLDPTLPQFPGTDGLVSNVLAYLSKDEVLLGVRSKGDIIRPLNPSSGPVREIVKYGTVFGVTVLPVVLGLWCWRRRQIWRQIITATYAPKPAA
jgi:gliding-associated putative ABC transporter substrate-binding component GldG